jgi:hypothetical protein
MASTHWATVSIFKRLVKRFILQTTPRNPLEDIPVIQSIQPITQIDDLLKDVKTAFDGFNLQTGDGTFTVPAGKRWHVHRYMREETTANSYIWISDGTNIIRLSASGTAREANPLYGIPMKEGWVIGIEQTSDPGDADRDFGILYEEEDAY